MFLVFVRMSNYLLRLMYSSVTQPIALHQLALELETKVIRRFHNHGEGQN